MDIEKTMQFILESQANAEVQMAIIRESQARTDAQILRVSAQADRTERTLRRAIALGVREARNERKRRQELAEAQKKTEESLKSFIDSLRLGGNGSH